jgi:TP901 family phage tail tape measure protein
MAGNEVVIRFRAESGNLNQILKQLQNELSNLGRSPQGLRNTSAAVSDLAQALGKSYGAAQKFATGLGLSATKASEAVNRLNALDAVNATNAEKFRVLAKELGITRQQFEGLNKAIPKTQESLQSTALATGAISAGLGAVGAKGLKTFADFDSAIRTFGVVTQSTGTAALAGLRAEVERLAKTTTKTPQEIAALAVELGKAGFSAQDTTKALAGVVQSSEATGEGLARTGEVIGSTLTQFGLSADQSQKIADLLTTASNASASGTNDLGEALSYVGAQAKDSNQSVEDTITTLAQLANSGIKGSSAGTGLAEALRRIKLASASASTELDDLKSRGSKNAIAAFDRLNVAVRDSEGKLKPFPQILDVVKQNLNSLNQSDQDLLNNALFGVQGGRVIASLLGQTEEKLGSVAAATGNYQGAVATASATLTQGFGPSLTLLASSLELGIQKIGEFLAVGVEPLVRGATAVINSFLGLSPALQGPILAIASLGAAFIGAVAVLTAFQALQVASTAAAVLSTAAMAAQAVATGAGTAATVLFNTQLSLTTARSALAAAGAAALAIAKGTLAGATTSATGAMTGFGAALTTVIGPLAALAAGLAVAELVRFTGQLEKQNAATEELRISTDTALQAGLKSQGALKNATIAYNEAKQAGLKLSDQQIAKEKEAQAQAERTLAALKKQLDEARKSPEAKAGFGGFGQAEADAQNNARKANIAAIENQIAAIDRQKKALADASKPASGAKTEPAKDSKDAKAAKDQAFQDAARRKDQAFQDAKALREQKAQDAKTAKDQAFQDAKAARDEQRADARAAREQAFQDAKAARDEQRADAKAARDEQRQLAAQERQLAFDARRQAQEDAFRQDQEAKTESFERRQREEQEAFAKQQSEAKRRFDEELSAEQKAIERRQQLRDSDPKDRAKLLKQFQESDRNAAELEPLEEKRRQFEKQQAKEEEDQKAKQAADLKAQKEAQQAEERALKEAQRAEEAAFKEQERQSTQTQKAEDRAIAQAEKAEDRALEQAQKAEDRAIAQAEKAEDRALERAFKEAQTAADRASKQSELELERNFKAQQRAEERAFKEEQRQRDLENAQKVKEISTPTPTPLPTTQKPTPRFLGGEAIAGNPYAVGERGYEIFVPSQDGYFLNHRDSLDLGRRSIAPQIQGLKVRQEIPAIPSEQVGLLAELKNLRKVVQEREQKISVPVTFEGPVTDSNFDRFLRLQRSAVRGGL